MKSPNLISKAAIMLCFLLLEGCARKQTIRFILPNGFRGIVKLQCGHFEGISIRATNNTLSLVVPETGVLTIKESLPTTDWHLTEACYANGNFIPVVDSGYRSANSIAFRTVGSNGTCEEWFVVGTFEELKAAKEKQDGFKWPSSKP